MKVYIASFFADKDRVKQRGAELEEIGIGFTSRWVEERAAANSTINDFEHDYFRETAILDLDDIVAADKLILTVPTDKQMADMPIRSLTRGGRHFEAGFMYGLIYAARKQFGSHSPKEVILLGSRENVFHFLDGLGVTRLYPAIKQFETWEEVKTALQEELNAVR